jgi:hypothetical protein
MLDLCSDVMSHSFTVVEEELCIVERPLGKEQLEANVKLEKRLSAKDDDGEIGLAMAGASGKNVFCTVFPFAPQPYIRGKRTQVVPTVGLPT